MQARTWLLNAVVLGLFSAGSVLAKEPTPTKARKISKSELIRICEAWFQSPYPYMFAAGPPAIQVAGKSYGMFEAGPRGIIDYGSLSKAMGKVLGVSSGKSWGDRTVIERAAGIPMILSKAKDWRSDFDRYNPAIITWGIENLIPDPESTILGHTAKRMYDTVFQRFFRLLAESYLTLTTNNVYTLEQQAYRAARESKSFDGLDWLDRRYAGLLRHHRDSGAAASPFTPPMAFGFWLRRGEDGTAKELWRGLQKVLNLYDKAWFTKAQDQKYVAP